MIYILMMDIGEYSNYQNYTVKAFKNLHDAEYYLGLCEVTLDQQERTVIHHPKSEYPYHGKVHYSREWSERRLADPEKTHHKMKELISDWNHWDPETYGQKPYYYIQECEFSE